MGMSLQGEYNFWETGMWQHPMEAECPCRGSGWALSDLDTVHRCRFHYEGQAHPKDKLGQELLAREEYLQDMEQEEDEQRDYNTWDGQFKLRTQRLLKRSNFRV